MVKEIRWSLLASEQLIETLQYWNERTGNYNYSKKLYSEIESILNLVRVYPEMGRKTSNPEIRRVIIKNEYGLYYSLNKELLEVKLWRSLKMSQEENQYE